MPAGPTVDERLKLSASRGRMFECAAAEEAGEFGLKAVQLVSPVGEGTHDIVRLSRGGSVTRETRWNVKKVIGVMMKTRELRQAGKMSKWTVHVRCS